LLELAVLEYVPTEQLEQLFEPTVALKLPALQFEHVDWPTVLWYEPEAQLVHAAPAAAAAE